MNAALSCGIHQRLFIVMALFVLAAGSGARAVDIGDPKEPIIETRTVHEKGGGFHNVYVHALAGALRKRAKDCIKNSVDDLKKELHDRMGKSITDDAITKEENSVDKAQVLPDEDFKEKFKNDPVALKRDRVKRLDGYTDSKGNIWFRQSSWSKGSDYFLAELLAHEGLHVVLQSAYSGNLRRNEQEEARFEDPETFIEGYLTRHCFSKGHA